MSEVLLSEVLLLGSDTPETTILRNALDADLVEVPALGSEVADARVRTSWPWADRLDAWRSETSDGPHYPKVVVAVWDAAVPPATDLASLDDADWSARHEGPFACWFAALGVATRRVADGGTIGAVIERPPPLDCAGRASETALADAVEAMVRSLARSEGPRGVRVNAATTPSRLAPEVVVAPPPPLARFPGSVEADVLGAVRLILDDDAIGITGSVINADDGRSWR